MKGKPLRVPLSRKIRAAADRLGKRAHSPHLPHQIKKEPLGSFFIWCGRWDLNPHVMDTRTSNVPVCLFQHFRITLYHYTICCAFVKTVSRQTPPKILVLSLVKLITSFLLFLQKKSATGFCRLRSVDFFFMDLCLCSAKYCQRSPIFRFFHLASNRNPVPYSHRP